MKTPRAPLHSLLSARLILGFLPAFLFLGAAAVSAIETAPFDGLGGVLEERGLWLGLIAVFLGGLALNLTPCVYPMIPVTLAYFGGQSAGKSRKTVTLAVSYVLGISISYAILGLVAAKTGSLIGSWLQQPAVLIGVAVVIVVLSLSMFGLYDLSAPQSVIQRVGQGSAGIGGAFLMGLGVGVIAAPCIGPFVLGLFLFVGKLANPLIGFLIFFVLGLGMGVPYIALAMGASSVNRLPKSGAWLVWSKKVLGVILLGLALYFIRPLVSGTVFVVSASVLLMGAGIYLGILEQTRVQHRLFPWIRKLVGLGLVVAGLMVVLPRPVPPPAVVWDAYTIERLEAARLEGKAVIIDVYADWCLPCIELDHVTFRHPDVVAVLETMTPLRVDATQSVTEEAEALLEKHNVYGVPTVLLFDREGNERKDLRILGFIKPDEALRRLEQL